MAFKKGALERRKAEQDSIERSPSAAFSDLRAARVDNAVGLFTSTDDVVREVTALWRDAQDKFLAIGRNLVAAKLKFPGTFQKEVIPKLPFDYAVANQLMAIARAVVAKRLNEDELPRTYSVAYHFTTLDEVALNEARQQGILCPDVKRKAVLNFKQALRDRQVTVDLGLKALNEKKRAYIEAKLSKAREQVRRLERELMEIERG